MKKYLINNLLTSGAILIGLLFVSCFINYSPPLYYFLVVLFFLFIYIIQSMLLVKMGKTPQRFLMIYNFMTVLKMFTSMVFLLVYFFHLAASASNKEKIYFSLFFIALYFLFLIINTKSFFSNNNERSGK